MPMRSDGPCETPVDKLRNEFDKLLEAVWSQGEKAVDAFGLRGSGRWSPAVDVVESADCVYVRLDLPGIDPEALEVTLVGNMLTVKGFRSSEEPKVGESAVRRERPSGTFTRSIPLPAAVDPEKVAADAKLGVVTVTLGKQETAKSRQIRVHVGKPCETP